MGGGKSMTDKEKLDKIVEVMEREKKYVKYPSRGVHEEDFPHVAQQILEALNDE